MKRKQLLTKVLLAVALLGGSVSAWADGNKRVLASQDYESATASDWTCPNGSAVLKTGDATYGKYAQCYPSGSGNRSCYKSVTYAYDPDGYTSADMTVAGYIIEFDFCIVSGNVEDRSVSQFVIPTTGPNLATNASYTGTDYIFSLSNSINYDLVAAGKSTDKNQVWYVNDLTNATGKTVTLDESWYHMTMVVTATSVESTISRDEETVVTDTKTVAALPQITGFWKLLGRGSGKINFDNLEIYDYVEAVTVSAPTFTFNKVDGINRNYTITNVDGSGTLYYTTSPAESAPAVGDAAYTSTTNTSIAVDFSESGNYYAYVLHTNGTTASNVTPQAVTAGALTLADPVFTVTDMVATDGFYYPVVTFASDNSALEGAPTATFDVASPYTFTGTGAITVTASAEGYTSSSSTFTVSDKYTLAKTIDFGALTASDFDGETWTSATGVPRDYWTNRAAAIPADVTYYKLTNTSSTAGVPDNSAVLDGITISNYYQRAPQVYIGYGLLTPYDALSGSGNYMNFTVNGGVATDYIVYNGWNNYGSSTFNTVQAGNASFGLYRYDTMLRTIKVYSPATVPATITSAGWATLYTPYALDFSGVTDLTAYTAVVADNKVTLTEVTDVPAGTGVVLKGAADTYNIPVAASSATAKGDLLGSATDATAYNAIDGYTLYMLKKVGEKAQFVPVTSGSIAAGKAYLKIAAATARNLDVTFADEATGISAALMNKETMNNEVYNLKGQRVAAPMKGLYIVNGKKMVIK